MSLLEQDITKKGQVDETTSRLKFESDNNSEKYKVEAICDSKVYAKELDSGQLQGLYYLVSWKSYLEEENTWEPASAVLHLHKLISIFHLDHPDKPTATSPPIHSTSPMARLTVRPTVRPEASSTKQKYGRPVKANGASKRVKKS